MRKQKQEFNFSILLLLSLNLGFMSCAKDKPYDTVYKVAEELKKSEIITKESITQKDGSEKSQPVRYLYVPMTLGTPMNVKGAYPYVQGSEKIVKLEWAKEGLNVIEIEKDKRFSDNDANNAPVLTIPGTYTSYRCQRDSYGDCTNREEENSELEWNEKDHFKPNFESLSVKEVNTLDLFALNNSSCLTKEDTTLVDYEISSGVINIELEKTYRVQSSNFSCLLDSFISDNLSINSFKVRYFYSLVKLDQLISKDYTPIPYPEADQNKFGFFTLENLVLNDNFDSQRKKKEVFLERWNPKKKSIKYYLSPEFSKEKNSHVKKAAFETVAKMNKEFSKNKIPLHLQLIEQTKENAVSPGDLRHNSIILIEDPLSNGILGYGPSVSNPFTGEILKASVNMYLGGLKSMTRSVYDSAIDISKEKLESNKAPSSKEIHFQIADTAFHSIPSSLHTLYEAVHESDLPPLAKEEEKEDEKGEGKEEVKGEGKESQRHIESSLPTEKVRNKMASHQIGKVHLGELRAKMAEHLHAKKDLSLKAQIKELKERGLLTKEDEKTLEYQARIEEYSKNNTLTQESFTIGGTSKVIYKELLQIDGIINKEGYLKKWDLLTDSQKESAQRIIVVSNFKSTLTHELGHNLGLRHNFMGSVDSKNFYTEDEANSLGLPAAPAYSSIMDYSFSQFNQLKVLGKYDIAALQFGYSRQVELSNGKLLNIDSTLEKSMKDLEEKQRDVKDDEKISLRSYQYCTDENAGLSSFCNRFDEGTTLEEIIHHRIEKYKRSYKSVNFRNGRLSYNSYQVPNYLFYRNYELGKIRDILEDYEVYANLFGDELLSKGCNPVLMQKYPEICTRINDYSNATNTAGLFLLSLASEPDHICAVAKDSRTGVIVDYMKLYDIYEQIKYSSNDVPRSCFDKSVKTFLESKGLVAVAEGGRFLNGFKDLNPNYRYNTDRYAKGTWPDRILAMRYLFKRRWMNSSSDSNYRALIDLPLVKERASSFLLHLTTGIPLEQKSAFTNEKGDTFFLNYVIDNSYRVNPLEDAFSWLRSILGMEDSGKTSYRKLLLKQIGKERTSYGEEYKDVAYQTRNEMAVQRTKGIIPENQREEKAQYLYDEKLRVTYTSVPIMPLSGDLIFAISNQAELSSLSKSQLSHLENLILGRGISPPQNTSLDEVALAFYALDYNLQGQFIDLAKGKVPASNIAFENYFEPSLAALLRSAYENGASYLSNLYELKKKRAQKEKEGLPRLQQKLMDRSPWLRALIAKGVLTKEYTEFLLQNLRMLPEYEAHEDARAL